MARSAALNPASMPFFPGGLRNSDDDTVGTVLGFVHDRDRSSISLASSDYRSARSSPSPPQLRNGLHTSPASQYHSPTLRYNDDRKSYPNLETRGAREGSMLATLGTLPESEDTLPTDEPEPLTATPPTAFLASSASPMSSQDSVSRSTTGADQSLQGFESQLKTSAVIHDILDRLIRTEQNQARIQAELDNLDRKLSLFIERALGGSMQPEFKDPFATSTTPSLSRPRPSMGNIAPNQPDISSQLNTLTTSVEQLLAIQTSQLQANPLEARSNSVIGLTHPDIAPNQTMPLSGLPLGLSARADARIRQPAPPQRTWSVGDVGMRSPDQARNDPLRDKRRSVVRRESSGVDSGDWPGGPGRDNGSTISKWEQLSLAPELLRSLGKFGVGPPNKIQQRALPFLLKGADIIAQAPPTQERIAAYVIPAIQVAFANMARSSNRGPIVIMISTTVDQATQAQRMIKDLGGPIGVRSALAVGAAGAEISPELRTMQQSMPHIICGTPQKLHALFTSPGAISGSEVRFLVLDEVDQLIARNLHEFVFTIVKLFPPPRSRPLGSNTPTSSIASPIPGSGSIPQFTSPFETSNPLSPFQSGRRFSTAVPSPNPSENQSPQSPSIERQTALFSNTVPQDVLNLATAIQLREPVRVLVRRDGTVANPDASQQTRGLRQFYLYLAFTAGGRSEPGIANPSGGLGIIGSGRSATSAETAQAREWKLDALADIFDDVEIGQAIVHVGGMTSLDSVVYKLASRGFEAIPLHGDMSPSTRIAALNKFRGASSVIRQSNVKVLVVYDVQVKQTDVPHVPLVINYDLPKAVEEYSPRVAPAIASVYARAGVVVNFVTATGGDVEMLRSIECFYKIKCPEVPSSLREIV